jgi:hypothetical protein
VGERFLKANIDWIRLLFDISVPSLQMVLVSFAYKNTIFLDKVPITLQEFFCRDRRYDFAELLKQVKYQNFSKGRYSPKVQISGSHRKSYFDFRIWRGERSFSPKFGVCPPK